MLLYSDIWVSCFLPKYQYEAQTDMSKRYQKLKQLPIFCPGHMVSEPFLKSSCCWGFRGRCAELFLHDFVGNLNCRYCSSKSTDTLSFAVRLQTRFWQCLNKSSSGEFRLTSKRRIVSLIFTNNFCK